MVLRPGAVQRRKAGTGRDAVRLPWDVLVGSGARGDVKSLGQNCHHLPPQCDTYNGARFQQYKLYCPGSGSHLTKFKFCPKRHKVFATPELDGLQFGWPMTIWPIAISFTRKSICGGKCYKKNPSTNQWSYFKTKRYPSLRQFFFASFAFSI